MAYASYKQKAIRAWTTDDVLEWVRSLGFGNQWRKQLEDTIQENMVSGNDLVALDNVEDVTVALGVNNKIVRKRFFLGIQQQMNRSGDQAGIIQAAARRNLGYYSSHTVRRVAYGTEHKEFEIRMFDGKKNLTLKRKATISTKVSEIQAWYKDETGVATDVSDIRLTAHSKLLEPHKTLQEVQIVDERHLITVLFRTGGGLAYAAPWSMKRSRVREIKFNQFGIKRSSKPDCLMGFDDTDCIDRADIGCGHAMAASTMYKYIEQVLQQDCKAVAIPCPMCKKLLDWRVCTRIADMSVQEYHKWTGIIEQRRIGDHKRCPHCKALCQKKEGVLIFRMKCAACHGPDWCWNCMEKWTVPGLIYCGNSQCLLIKQVDKTLAEAEKFTPKYLKNAQIPRIRACPMCLTFVEHKEGVDACKHINKCVGCGGAFCFVCLGIKGPNGWPCHSYTHECTPAPVQSHKNKYGQSQEKNTQALSKNAINQFVMSDAQLSHIHPMLAMRATND